MGANGGTRWFQTVEIGQSPMGGQHVRDACN